VLQNGTNVKLFEQIVLGIGIPYSLGWNILGWFVVSLNLKKFYYAFGLFV
jgi:hypothetical protein